MSGSDAPQHGNAVRPSDGLDSLPSVLGELFVGIGRSVRRFPITAGLVALVVLVWSCGVLVPASVFLGIGGTLAAFVRLRYPHWWRQQVSAPCRRYRTRRRFIVEWGRLCDRTGLSVKEKDARSGDVTRWTPRLSRLRWTPGGGVLTARVRVLTGQTVDALRERADAITAFAGSTSCRVRQTGPATVELALQFDDALSATVPAFRPASNSAELDLTGLQVGRCEDGEVWRLPLTGTHLLVVGVTGAGKSSVVWSLLAAVAPAIRDGWVQVWAVDGKGGMELSSGRALFSRFATTAEHAVTLLEDAAEELTARTERMAGHTRTHEPSVGEPLLLVLVDEVALLTAYTPDRKLRDRAERALAAIATQGRAPGVVLIAALQDPRKEVLSLRNLFPTKIALRLDEKIQVDMVLGDGARSAGAECDKIPESLPGVAYVKIDGIREPTRVRAGYLTDSDIHALAADFATPYRPVVVTKPRVDALDRASTHLRTRRQRADDVDGGAAA